MKFGINQIQTTNNQFFMQKILLKKAFEKARKETESNILTRQSEYLSDFIFNDTGEQYGERSLRDKFNEIRSGEEIDFELRSYVKNALSHFLGCTDYENFKKENKNTKIDILQLNFWQRIVMFIKDNKILIRISLSIMIIAIIIISITQKRWMVWQNDHYVEAKFDSKLLTNGTLKLYKKDRILYFKQIAPNCDTQFFNDDGSENLWYGKNVNRELEYFTGLGKHPGTGKTLKKITKYMIQTHICETYK